MKKVISVLLVIVMLLQATIVFAARKDELQSQQKENAENMAQKLKAAGFDAIIKQEE